MQSSPLRNLEQNLISLISNSFKLLETFCFSSAKKRQSCGDLRGADDCIKKREEMIMKLSVTTLLCPIVQNYVPSCLSNCQRVYRPVFTEFTLLKARKYRRYFLPGSQDVLTLCPVINFIDLYILLASVFVRKQKHKI